VTLSLKGEHVRHIGVQLTDERLADERLTHTLNESEKLRHQPPGNGSADLSVTAGTHPAMPRSVPVWDEDSVLALPLENDRLERQGVPLLDLNLSGATESRVRSELAKHLSAFANTSGGQILYGLSKNGFVDHGGISRVIKGQPTKEWLENAISESTECEIAGVNVFEVLPRPHDSAVADGKAIYVVHVPHSERAPHQSAADMLYYVRLGAKSQPACHRLIEDIRNRVKHPDVSVTEVALVNVFLAPQRVPRVAGTMGCRLQVFLKNAGMLKASTACVQIEAEPAAFFGDFENTAVIPRRTAARNVMFWEIQGPVYPGMEINFWFDLMLPMELLKPVAALRGAVGIPQEMTIVCRLLADNAPTKSRTLDLINLVTRQHTGLAKGPAAAGMGCDSFLALQSNVSAALSPVCE
jgi:hypothetical protein